jgi:hypothetical protein
LLDVLTMLAVFAGLQRSFRSATFNFGTTIERRLTMLGAIAGELPAIDGFAVALNPTRTRGREVIRGDGSCCCQDEDFLSRVRLDAYFKSWIALGSAVYDLSAARHPPAIADDIPINGPPTGDNAGSVAAKTMN